MVRMAFEARIIHLRHLRVSFQISSHFHGIFILSLDAYSHGFYASFEQPNRIITQRTSKVFSQSKHLVNMCLRSCYSSCTDIRMPTHIFRCRVNDHIYSKICRVLVYWTGKSVVYHAHNTRFFSHSSHCF